MQDSTNTFQDALLVARKVALVILLVLAALTIIGVVQGASWLLVVLSLGLGLGLGAFFAWRVLRRPSTSVLEIQLVQTLHRIRARIVEGASLAQIVDFIDAQAAELGLDDPGRGERDPRVH